MFYLESPPLPRTNNNINDIDDLFIKSLDEFFEKFEKINIKGIIKKIHIME